MVVTSSRLAAVRYTMAFRSYIKKQGYDDINVLVAFSGSIDEGTGPQTEASMNGFSDTQTAKKFDTDSYNVMIVANKFQTGFDQPKLCAMYVDKMLTGIAAVQTLSRLNRTCPGKTEVFVLDFVNDWETIKAAFDDYYTVTEIDRTTDINVVYEMEKRIVGYHIYTDQEVINLTNLWYGTGDTEKILPKLLYFLEPAKDRYEGLEEDKKYEFRELVKKFIRSYGFVTQMVALQDEDLHRLNCYLTFLYKELPWHGGDRVDLTDEVDLDSIRIEDRGERSIELEGGSELKNSGGSAGIKVEDEREPLSVIIDNINELFGIRFEHSDKILEACMDTLSADEELLDYLNSAMLKLFYEKYKG